MKNKLHILVCITALSVLPLWAGDGEGKSVSVEQRFRQTDLSLALRHYERVQMEAFEARLKLDLLETEDKMTQSERGKKAESLAKRVAILKQRAAELRDTAYKFGEEIAGAPVPITVRLEKLGSPSAEKSTPPDSVPAAAAPASPRL